MRMWFSQHSDDLECAAHESIVRHRSMPKRARGEQITQWHSVDFSAPSRLLIEPATDCQPQMQRANLIVPSVQSNDFYSHFRYKLFQFCFPSLCRSHASSSSE